MDLCTLDDVKARLQITGSTGNDSLLQQLIAAMSSRVRRYLGRTFSPVSQLVFDWRPSGRYHVGAGASVSSVQVAGQDLPSTAWKQVGADLYVYSSPVPIHPEGAVVVSGSFGQPWWNTPEEVDPDLRDLVAGMVARRWRQIDAGMQSVAGTDAFGRPTFVVTLTPEERSFLDRWKGGVGIA